jgi:hypothetical protein
MPYPETCPECGGAFRNTGTHYTARRNEVGRHILLELGCQNTSRRYWWDFTTGNAADDGASPARRASLETTTSLSAASALNGARGAGSNGSAVMATLDPPVTLEAPVQHAAPEIERVTALAFGSEPPMDSDSGSETDRALEPSSVELPGSPPSAPASLKDAFIRQLQLDRLTLRQMRSWLMAEDARRAIEVAAGATEATYERLALILFGVDLPQLLGKQPTVPASQGMSAEERLELQREKARIRARLRRAAAKAARTQG